MGCGLLSVAVVLHHPMARGHSAQQLLHKIAEVSAADQLVHGVLIALSLGLTYGFCMYVLRRDSGLQVNVAGLLCYLFGTVALGLASIIDGFFTPAFASAILGSNVPALTAGIEVLRGGAVMIQVLTKVGFVVMSGAILFWSVGLLGSTGRIRYAAIAGAVAGIVPLAILLLGPSQLNAESGALILLSQAVWYVTIGALMLRREL